MVVIGFDVGACRRLGRSALPAVEMGEHHTPLSGIDLRHAAGVARFGTDAVDVVMEDRCVARPIVGDVATLRARQVEIDLTLELKLRTA